MSLLRKPIALGYKAFILDAIRSHQKRFAGSLPNKVVLHPNVYSSLLRELDPLVAERMTRAENMPLKMYGTPIVRSNFVLANPYIVNCQGRVEWL